MINLTSVHNWIAIAAMLLLLGFVLHQAGNRIAPLGKVVSASFGA